MFLEKVFIKTNPQLLGQLIIRLQSWVCVASPVHASPPFSSSCILGLVLVWVPESPHVALHSVQLSGQLSHTQCSRGIRVQIQYNHRTCDSYASYQKLIIATNYVLSPPSQASVLHACTFTVSPTHSWPPCWASVVFVLDFDWLPPPHVFEQVVQSVAQSPQTQST